MMVPFNIQTERFLADLGTEILATPTGERREVLTEAQIHLLKMQDDLKKLEAS